jgi:hypothetical protein
MLNVEDFLNSWLAEKSVPSVEAQTDGSTIIIKHSGPFHFPIDVTYQTGGKQRAALILLGNGDATIDTGLAVSNVVLDPEHKLLLRR